MQLPRPWFGLAVALTVLALGACGPSSQQVKAARAAQYHGESNLLFRAVVDAIADAKYKVERADAATGTVATEARWYEPDGTFEDKTAKGDGYMIENGSILLGYEVRLTEAGGHYQVQVVPRAMQVREGSAQPHPMNEQDPAMSGWISGKTDDLYLAINKKLKVFEVKPGA